MLRIILTGQLREVPSLFARAVGSAWRHLLQSSHSRYPGMLSGTIIQPVQQGTYTSKHVQLAYARRVYQYHTLALQ